MAGKAEPPAPPMRKIHVRSGSGSNITVFTDKEHYNGIEINVEVPYDEITSLKMYNPTGSNAIYGQLYIYEELDLRGLNVTDFFRNQVSLSGFWRPGNKVMEPYGLKNIRLEDGQNLSGFFYNCNSVSTGFNLSDWVYKDVIMTNMFYGVTNQNIYIPNLLPKVGYNHGQVFSSYQYGSSGSRRLDISGWNREHAEGIDWYGSMYNTICVCKQEVADYIASKIHYSENPTFEIVG